MPKSDAGIVSPATPEPYTSATEIVWLIHVEKLLDIYDVMEIIQYKNQGWNFHEIDKYYSGMIRASYTYEVKGDWTESFIEDYVEALKSCSDFEVKWYERKK